MKTRSFHCFCAPAPPLARGDFGAAEIHVRETPVQFPGVSRKDGLVEKEGNPR